MDAEQLGALVRARCRRSLHRVSTAGLAPVLDHLPDLGVPRRRLVLLPDGWPPVPRAAPDDDEDVRYLHPAAACGAGPDFVLVDDRWAVRLLHDDHGRFTAAVEVPAAAVDSYRCRWDLGWSQATTVIPRPVPPRGR